VQRHKAGLIEAEDARRALVLAAGLLAGEVSPERLRALWAFACVSACQGPAHRAGMGGARLYSGTGTGTRPRSTRPERSGLTCGLKMGVFMPYGRSALGEHWK
jgi:hypothetical protein